MNVQQCDSCSATAPPDSPGWLHLTRTGTEMADSAWSFALRKCRATITVGMFCSAKCAADFMYLLAVTEPDDPRERRPSLHERIQYTEVMRARTRDEERAYKAAFAAIVAQFHDDKITVDEKRQAIIDLNDFYFGDRPATIAKRNLVVVTEPAVSRETKVPVLVPGRFADDDEDEREPWWQR